MTSTELMTTGVTWLWLVAIHSFLMGLAFYAWTRVEALAPGRSRRFLLAMILLLPPATATLALIRRSVAPGTAWFESGRVLNLTLFDDVRFVHLVILAGAVTVLVTLFQEVVPVFFPPERSDHPVPDKLVDAARAEEGWEELEVIMIEDRLAVATGGTPWRPRLYFSAVLAESFDQDQIKAIVRHEHAHMVVGRWWATHLLFAARMIQAVNPVAMWVSREYAVENEIACDLEAAGDDRDSLARVLFAIYEETGSHDSARRRVLQRRIDILLGRAPELYRIPQLPSASLLFAGALMALLLPWVI